MKSTLQNYYFPSGLRWVWGIIGSGLAVWSLLSGVWIIGVLLIISIIGVATFYSEIIVDTRNELLIDRYMMMGIPLNSNSRKAGKLNAIRLEKERKGYTKNSAMGGTTGTADFYYYTAYLEFDQNEEFELLTKSEWVLFREKIYQVADELSLEIYRTF
jgi:hypothetical protein